MTPKECLQKARELITEPLAWTQGFFARDKNGWKRMPMDAEACSFCGLGAVIRAAGNDCDLRFRAEQFLYAAAGAGVSISWFNDTKTHAEVLDLFDRAIEAAA